MNELDIRSAHPLRRKVIRDVANLSSGTLATLTGLSNSNKLDKVQKALYEFTLNSDVIFEDWNDAWRSFLDDHNLKYNKKGITNEDIINILV